MALSGKTHINPRDSFPFEYDDEFKSGKVDADNPYPAIDRLMTESVAADTPFCLFACSNEPHTPWNKGDASAYSPESLQLPPSWVDTPITRDAYAAYLAEITYFDAQCGKLLELLDRHKLQSDTLVMVVSEQGSSFPFAKWTCYEQGLASGMIVRWPGHVAAGSTTDALVEYCDVAPTFLEAAGAQVPDTMDGRSFLAVLEGRADEHKQYTFGIHTTRGIINGSDHFGIRSCGTKTHRYIRKPASGHGIHQRRNPSGQRQRKLLGQLEGESRCGRSARGRHDTPIFVPPGRRTVRCRQRSTLSAQPGRRPAAGECESRTLRPAGRMDGRPGRSRPRYRSGRDDPSAEGSEEVRRSEKETQIEIARVDWQTPAMQERTPCAR